MGLVFTEIELVSDDDLALNRHGYILEDKIRHCTVRAMADSGATMLEIPIHISKQLDLPKIRQIEAELADGSVGFYDGRTRQSPVFQSPDVCGGTRYSRNDKSIIRRNSNGGNGCPNRSQTRTIAC